MCSLLNILLKHASGVQVGGTEVVTVFDDVIVVGGEVTTIDELELLLEDTIVVID